MRMMARRKPPNANHVAIHTREKAWSGLEEEHRGENREEKHGPSAEQAKDCAEGMAESSGRVDAQRLEEDDR